jgi:hypothetical protein
MKKEVYKDKHGNKLVNFGGGFYATDKKGKLIPKVFVPVLIKEYSREKAKIGKSKKVNLGKEICYGSEISLGKKLDFGKSLDFGKELDLG